MSTEKNPHSLDIDGASLETSLLEHLNDSDNFVTDIHEAMANEEEPLTEDDLMQMIRDEIQGELDEYADRCVEELMAKIIEQHKIEFK